MDATLVVFIVMTIYFVISVICDVSLLVQLSRTDAISEAEKIHLRGFLIVNLYRAPYFLVRGTLGDIIEEGATKKNRRRRLAGRSRR